MSKKKQIKTIVIALRLSFSSHREILHAISTYAKVQHWSLRLLQIPNDFTLESIRQLVDEKIDGLITSDLTDNQMFRILSKSDIPIVSIGKTPFNPASGRLSSISNDERAIGHLGAEYLCSLGKFRSFGFLSADETNESSRERQHGFEEVLVEQGHTCSHHGAQDAHDGSERDLTSIGNWLLNLNKPAAIMAVYDIRATHLMEAAKRQRIRIPKSVSVIAVDNDELLCDFTDPPLTSIAPDFSRIGLLAGKEMTRLLRKKAAQQLLVPPKRIIERESTKHIPPAAHIVNEAMDFIRRNALNGISADDVVAHLGISHRLADLRFRESTGSSLLATIIATRIDAVKRRLTFSHATIKAISAACGFQSENHAKKVFRQKVGMSMSEFRRHAQNSIPKGQG